MHGGGPLRTASILEYLRKRDFAVDLILFNAPSEPPGFEDVLSINLPKHSKSLPARLVRNAFRFIRQVPPLVDRFSGYEKLMAKWLEGRTYDVAVIEHFWAAPYVDLLRRHAVRVVCNLHNVESVWLKGMRLPFVSAARRLEHNLLPMFDTVLVTSKDDAARIPVPSVVYPNAIPFREKPVRPAVVAGQPRIAMSANFEFAPNSQGAQWFARKVWPLLNHIPWKLIGRYSEQMSLGVATGPVEDALPELARVDVAIVPLLAGSGTRLKILEAWAAGTPVVSTTIGCEGLGVTSGVELLIGDTPEQFADAVERLLESKHLRAALAIMGRRRYEEEFTWPKAWEKLDEARALY